MIFRNQMPAAVVQFGEQPRPAIAIAMNPLFRGQGLCVSLIRLTLDQPELRHFDAIYGFIEPDNLASLRCVEKAGFSRVSDILDTDGMFEVVFTRLSQ
jgi:RimJ/RimL family protein N-acetyltransferase